MQSSAKKSPLNASQGFFRFFPTPKFLEMPSMGLYISDDAIHAISFRKTSHGLVVDRFFEKLIPENVVVAGDVVNKEALLKILRSLQEEAGQKFVHVSLPDEKSFVYKTQIPNVAGSNLRQSVEFTLEENIPLPPADVFFDFEQIGRGTLHGDILEVNVCAIPRLIETTYSDLLFEAGFIPLSFEIKSQAIANAVVSRSEKGTYLLMHIGGSHTSICIVDQGMVRFTSTVNVGANTLTSALEREFKLSHVEAEKIKREKSFLNNAANNEFFTTLLNTVAVVKDEMHKVEIFWEDHLENSGGKETPIEKIILSGSDATLPGFLEHIAQDSGKKVVLGNVWANVLSFETVIPPIPHRESFAYAGAIGLALPQ